MITHTLDTFLESDLKVCAEIALEVNMCLLARPEVTVAQIERVYSIPVALAQVRRWLGANLPNATLVESRSTAEAARLARDDARGAAVGSELAAKLNELSVLRRKIEDLAHNMTRFLVLGRDQAEPTGRDKTSLLLVTRDEAGILYRVLGAFAGRGLNMTKIESRRRAGALGSTSSSSTSTVTSVTRPSPPRSRTSARLPRRSRCSARTRAPTDAPPRLDRALAGSRRPPRRGRPSEARPTSRVNRRVAEDVHHGGASQQAKSAPAAASPPDRADS